MSLDLLNLAWEEAADLLDALADQGLDEDTAIALAARLLDAAVPFDAKGGPVGKLLEQHDGELFELALRFMWRLIERDDEAAATDDPEPVIDIQARGQRRERRRARRRLRVRTGRRPRGGARVEVSATAVDDAPPPAEEPLSPPA